MQKVHVSKLMGKLEGFPGIGTNTLTNEFCSKMHKKGKGIICSYCYSFATLESKRWPSLEKALERNKILYQRALKDSEIPRFTHRFVRFNQHGELHNRMHVLNLWTICAYNPETTFALWTKRPGLVQATIEMYGKPDNLKLVYSNPKVDSIKTSPPQYFDKVFNNVNKGYAEDQENCTGQKCKDCLLCYISNDVTTIVERIK